MFKKNTHYVGRIVDELVIPWVSPSRRLSVQYWKHVSLLGWEPEIKYIRDYANVSYAAIDVGANIGLWSYSMVKSCMFDKVLAFEPNPALTRDLQNTGFSNVTIIHKAVSSEQGASYLRIPQQAGRDLSGWASLETKFDPDANEFREIPVETIRLDDLKVESVGFIKIDVEGHELSVLEGGRKFFVSHRPVCLIECRDRSKRQVEEFFVNLKVGYSPVDTKKRYGFDLSMGNALFAAS